MKTLIRSGAIQALGTIVLGAVFTGCFMTQSTIRKANAPGAAASPSVGAVSPLQAIANSTQSVASGYVNWNSQGCSLRVLNASALSDDLTGKAEAYLETDALMDTVLDERLIGLCRGSRSTFCEDVMLGAPSKEMSVRYLSASKAQGGEALEKWTASQKKLLFELGGDTDGCSVTVYWSEWNEKSGEWVGSNKLALFDSTSGKAALPGCGFGHGPKESCRSFQGAASDPYATESIQNVTGGRFVASQSSGYFKIDGIRLERIPHYVTAIDRKALGQGACEKSSLPLWCEYQRWYLLTIGQ